MSEEQRSSVGRPAVFLDRDGTILVEKEYLSDSGEVEPLPGALDALERLRDAGYLLVVVTNQSGIARGYYGETEYAAVRARLDEILAERGIRLAATYHCPHHPDHTGPCDCRKPGVALFERAIEQLGIDPTRSWWVGDRLRDVEMAGRFGGNGILVRTGYGRAEEPTAPADVVVVDDLSAAAERAGRP